VEVPGSAKPDFTGGLFCCSKRRSRQWVTFRILSLDTPPVECVSSFRSLLIDSVWLVAPDFLHISPLSASRINVRRNSFIGQPIGCDSPLYDASTVLTLFSHGVF
jgi:hypothetical protein